MIEETSVWSCLSGREEMFFITGGVMCSAGLRGISNFARGFDRWKETDIES